MNCTYCQQEMKQYGYYDDPIWMCHNHHAHSMIRVDHYYRKDSLDLYKIKIVVWRFPAQFPYHFDLDLINKTTEFHHLKDRKRVIDYSNDTEFRIAIQHLENKEPVFTLDFIPEDLNPDTVNQYLDRCLKLAVFF